MFCKIEDLKNESDVEQKFIVPLLLNDNERGFGYSSSDYHSKSSVMQLEIEKGKQKKKWYSPDFVVYIQGAPVLVIEAKQPNEDLEEGYREARLYATELNAKYPSGINPCIKVLATNGNELWYGKSDTEHRSGKLVFQDVALGSIAFNELNNFCNKKTLSDEVAEVLKKINNPKQFHRPTAIMGSRAGRGDEVTSNIFGTTLMTHYQRVFNPSTSEDRVEIVKNAYITSSSINKHLDPIKKAILSAVPPSLSNVTKIQDTSNPKEIIGKFFGRERIANQLMLLVGNVGSGKTTFIHYLREIAITEEVNTRSTWVHIDLNNAPSSKEEIYSWISEKIIFELKKVHSEKNLSSIEELKKIYAPEIKDFEEGEGSLLLNDQTEYNRLLVQLIGRLKENVIKTSKSHTRYLCGEKGKSFILVLDNCDKRDKDTQLLMFEVANWAKEEYKAVVFLPLRDVTFDLHRTQPPLDTVVQDMIFRIDPPSLSEVLHRRIAYAISEYGETIRYSTGNNMHFTITKEEQERYLACTLESLYNSTPLAKKIIDGLAGRDIRRGLGIFIAFCKSGHITAEKLIQMRLADGAYKIDSHIVMRALLRGDKKFYSDKNSYIKNLFASYPGEEKKVDPFARISILSWFDQRKAKKGPSNVKGFHPISELIKDMQVAGHDPDRILDEVVFLMGERCLLSESQIEESIEEIGYNAMTKTMEGNSLVMIAPAGRIHLELLLNMTYIAACSEDCWYENQKSAQDIAARISNKEGPGQFSIYTVIKNSQDLISNLIDYRDRFYPQQLLKENGLENIDIEAIRLMVDENQKRFDDKNKELLRTYPIGSTLTAIVKKHKHPGLIVDLSQGVGGLVLEKDLPIGVSYHYGEKVEVVIEGLDETRSKFNLKLK